MKKLLFILTFVVIMSFPVSLLADDVSYAEYRGTIVGTNSAGLASMVSGAVNINSSGWIAAGVLNAQATNISVRDSSETVTAFMPGYNTSPLIVYAGDIAANGNEMYTVYTGNVSGGKIRYFPGSTGFTVTDNSTIEPGSNFSFELKGLFDTSSGSSDVYYYKLQGSTVGGMRVNNDSTTSGTINGEVWAAPAVINITPDGLHSSGGGLTPNGEATTWQCVDDPVGAPDDAATYINDALDSAENTETYTLTTPGLPTVKNIVSVEVRWRATQSAAGAGVQVRPWIRYASSGSIVWGTLVNTTTSWADYTQTFTNGPNGVSWNDPATDWVGLAAGLCLKDNGAQSARVTQCYVKITYNTITRTSVTGVSSGEEHTLTFGLSGGTLSLDIDGSSNTAAYAGSIPDTSSNYQIAENTAVIYMEEAALTIGGVEEGRWSWQYGSTFADQSGHNHTATPTFRTTTSDGDCTFLLNNFYPISTSSADYEPDVDWPSMISSTPDQPATFYTENSTPGIFFAPLIHTFWPASGVPESFFWYNFTFTIIIIAGILSYRMHPSLLLKIIVGMAIMIFWALPGINVYGMFVALYKGLYCFGILLLSKHYGW
ncbi:MAG: hypothetical protein A2Y58_03195 [Chloroflexi bacterium RBG_13_51_52]|nr:MAG: hypothetical protein A2Y58_03195 [Chloroflexi bacterium RBG_13_51_52]